MEGYAKVAELMGRHPELAMFRKFRTSNMRNLLYLQAEITYLEEELFQLSTRDLKHGHTREHFCHDWWFLAHAETPEDQEQWSKALQLRQKLEQYNRSVANLLALFRAESPSRHDLAFLRNWFRRPSMGAQPLLGMDRKSWSVLNEHDLAALAPRHSPDRFSRWFIDCLVPYFHRFLGSKSKVAVSEDLGTGIYEYDESKLKMIAFIVTTIVASVLPLCSVVMLSVVQSKMFQLAIIVVLSCGFSLALALMTNARQIEVFAATSAFAAVNVVYSANNPSTTPHMAEICSYTNSTVQLSH